MDKPRRVRVGAYGVIVQEGKILLCRINEPEHGDHRKWTLPGGGLDFGEDPRAGALREILEETGCLARLGDILEIDSYVTEFENEHFQAIRILYRATIVSGSPTAEQDGTTDDCAWFSVDEVMDIGLVGLARTALRFM